MVFAIGLGLLGQGVRRCRIPGTLATGIARRCFSTSVSTCSRAGPGSSPSSSARMSLARRSAVNASACRPLGVQAHRQQSPTLLAQRVLAGEHLRGEDGVGRRAGPEHGLAPSLPGEDPQAVQPGCLGDRPRLGGELGIGGPTPETQRPVEQLPGRCGSEVSFARRTRDSKRQASTASTRQPNRIARRLADQHRGRSAGCPVRFQGAPQVRDVGLERADRLGRRFAVPQVLDQSVDRNDLSSWRPTATRARCAGEGRRGRAPRRAVRLENASNAPRARTRNMNERQLSRARRRGLQVGPDETGAAARQCGIAAGKPPASGPLVAAASGTQPARSSLRHPATSQRRRRR